MKNKRRAGIASGGNWIVDRVKIVDRLPGRGMLGSIRSETFGTGGAAANVLLDLARMKAPFPLQGVGVVGKDADGRFLLDMAREHGIDVSALTVTDRAPTSYTDVMTEEGSGDRTFYHCRGANALFGAEHIPVESLPCRIFHLGYILLLDRMDEAHPRYGTVAASILDSLQKAGIRTSVDVVSEESDRFSRLVPPALKYVNYLILNEIEIGRVVGKAVRRPDGSLDGPALREAVAEIYRFGNMEMVAVHMPEGVYIRERKGREFARGSFILPEGFIKGTVGAGDAFCAGMLFGIHEDWDFARAAELGICCATTCLSDPTTTYGVIPAAEALKFVGRFPERRPPVEI